MSEERVVILDRDLAAVIAKHVDWLDGRTFQRTCLSLAEGYWPQDDLDELMSGEEVVERLVSGLQAESP